VGLGFVGLRTAISFCDREREVVGVDIEPERVDEVNDGHCPILTVDANERLASHVAAGRFRATTDLSTISGRGHTYVVSVPTPVTDRAESDFSYLRAAGESVARYLDEDDLVVLQSTVPPGTIQTELIPALESSGLVADEDFGVAHAPERYSPRDDVSLSAPRVVAATSASWQERVSDLYRPVVESVVPVDSIVVAESTKIIENVQRDVNIALVNELARLLGSIGVDIWKTLDAAETKWNFHRYDPGLGVGGHCIPVDPYHLLNEVADDETEGRLVSAARQVNNSMPVFYSELLIDYLNAVETPPSSATVTVEGIGYKAGVRDLRNSPAVALIECLREYDVNIRVYDECFEAGERINSLTTHNCESLIDAVDGADALVLSFDVTRSVDFSTLAESMASDPVLLDVQASSDPDTAKEAGFHYCRLDCEPSNRTRREHSMSSIDD
jgi:UDP-N-acetyl-D-galactosamine dehydrogenase